MGMRRTPSCLPQDPYPWIRERDGEASPGFRVRLAQARPPTPDSHPRSGARFQTLTGERSTRTSEYERLCFTAITTTVATSAEMAAKKRTTGPAAFATKPKSMTSPTDTLALDRTSPLTRIV